MDEHAKDADAAWKLVFGVLGFVYGLFLLGVFTVLLID